MIKSPGETLKAFRTERGLSRSDLAKQLEVDRMTVWRYEEANREIDEKILPRVVKVTGIPAAVWRPDLVRLLATGAAE